MLTKINNSWDDILSKEFGSEYFILLDKRINEERTKYICFPKEEDVFNCFRFTPFEKVKVVILGQDPYHNFNQAMGLSFSVPRNEKIPPSLENIYKELVNDIHIDKPKYGDLTSWAKEGVLLLNTTLTVRKGQAFSHKNLGWEIFTDNVIRIINNKTNPIVFILWGRPAQEKARLIDEKRHFIIKSAHPSPLSAYNGFFGSKPFSKTNTFLRLNEIEPVDWSVIE